MRWEKVRLDDVLELKYGKDHKKLEEGNIPCLGTGGIMRFVNKSIYDDVSILIPRKGSLNNIYYYDVPFWSVDTLFYSKIKRSDISAKFVYYQLKTINLYNLNVGSAVPSLTTQALNKLIINLPPLPIQKKIASILSTYDELIENNLKQIRLLEEAATRLYQEWFVDFRFPNVEKTVFVDGLPKGWEVKSLEEVCRIIMGQSPKSEFYNKNKEGLPFHQGVTGYSFRFVEHQTYSTEGSRKAEKGDILFSVRAPVGRLNISLDEIIIGRGLCAIKNKQGFQSFQYYQLKNHFYKDDIIGTGTIYNSVTKSVLLSLTFIQPNKKVIEQFEKIVSTIDEKIENLSIYNRTLQESRELLLPRLMSGEITVIPE